MKKIVIGLLSLTLLLFVSTGSFAYQVYWDLGGVGITGFGAPYGDADNMTSLFDELAFYSETTVTQYDSDGNFVVNSGDAFTDNGSINATGLVPATADDEGLGSIYEVTGTLVNMSGIVTGVSLDSGTGDTEVDYKYNTGFFNLYAEQPRDADYNTRGASDDSGFNDGTFLATFELISGIGHTFLDTSGDDITNQGSGEFYLQATDLATGFWFDADGNDIALIYNDVNLPINWFVSTTDYNVDKPIFTQGVPGQDDYLFTLDVTHDGSIEFNVVPEPSTFILLGFGLAGLGFYSRRRKS